MRKWRPGPVARGPRLLPLPQLPPIDVLRLLRHSFPLYVGSGGVATLSHYLVTIAAVELGAIRPVVASAAGFAVGAVVKYWLNYHYAFRSRAAHLPALVRFAVTLAILFVLNGLIFWILNERLGVYYLVAQVITTIVLLVPGYFLSRDWVFRHAER